MDVALPSPRRLSVPLTGRDLADLETIRRSPERLNELEVSSESSEAALVHAVFEKGLQLLKEEARERAYEELAADEELIAYKAARRSVPRRRRPE